MALKFNSNRCSLLAWKSYLALVSSLTTDSNKWASCHSEYSDIGYFITKPGCCKRWFKHWKGGWNRWLLWYLPALSVGVCEWDKYLTSWKTSHCTCDNKWGIDSYYTHTYTHTNPHESAIAWAQMPTKGVSVCVHPCADMCLYVCMCRCMWEREIQKRKNKTVNNYISAYCNIFQCKEHFRVQSQKKDELLLLKKKGTRYTSRKTKNRRTNKTTRQANIVLFSFIFLLSSICLVYESSR